jgi:hypothetical protein
MSQTFMLQGSHTGSPPVMQWGGSPAAGQPSTWPSPPPLAAYWPPPPLVGHSSQSSTTPPPPSGQGYWPPPPWAPLARGQAPPWGIPLWTTLQPQWHSLPPTLRHLCLLSIVPFVIRANVEYLAYSSIYVFKCLSSSTGRDFVDGVLNMGGSDEDEGGGSGYDAAPWSSCMSYNRPCVKTMWIFVWRLCIVVWRLRTFVDLCLIMWYIYCCIIFYCMPVFLAPHPGRQPKQGLCIKNQYVTRLTKECMTIYSSVN